MDVKERMRKDWDDRAHCNAFYYIASWKEEWDVDEFLRSGQEDYLTLVAPILERCGLEKPAGLMLEPCGCV